MQDAELWPKIFLQSKLKIKKGKIIGKKKKKKAQLKILTKFVKTKQTTTKKRRKKHIL